MSEPIELAAIALATMGIIALLALAAMFGINQPSCYASFRGSGMDARWSLMSGCQVKADGRWIPADAYRVTKVDG